MQIETTREHTMELVANWGRWARQGGYNGGYKSILGQYYMAGYRISRPAVSITDEEALMIDRTIASLGADSPYHCVLLLHFVIGKSEETIGEILGMSRSTARRRIESAVDEIHERLYG